VTAGSSNPTRPSLVRRGGSPGGGRSGRDREVADETPWLVARAQRGDPAAFARLYQLYQPEVAGYVRRLVGDQTVADDLTSDTFLRAWQQLASFRWQGRSLVAWLVTIAHNLARDHWKSLRSRYEVLDTGQSMWGVADRGPEGRPAEVVLARLELADVLDALDHLSADQRACLHARFIEELSVAETAARLGKTPGAVKVIQHRALHHLRAHLAAHRPPPSAEAS